MIAPSDRRDLAPGVLISPLIKGGWQLAGGHGAVDRESALADMHAFVEAGLDTFDCADIYTGVEELIGEFLRRYRARYGREAASRIRVHTKFVPDLDRLATLGRADVERAVDRSLRRLGVEALDLVQLHWWDYGVPRYVEAALWLDDLRRAGKLRHLGATNFATPRLREMLDAGVPIVSHQVQYSLLDRRPERAMTDLCRERGVSLLSYGALLGGFLSDKYLGAPEPRPPFENRSLTKYALIIEEFGGWARFQEALRVAAGIARNHATTLAAVALRFVLDRPQVAGVIVGARHARHLEGTLAALRLCLDGQDRAALEAVGSGAPGPAGDVYGLERVKGGRHADIMRYDLNASP